MFSLANHQAGQPQADEKRGDPLFLIYWLCVIHSNCIIVFLRTGFGREALGMRGFLALVLLLLCLGGEPLMVLWIAAFLVAVIVQRIITFRAIRRGAVLHTLYAGTPLFMKLPLVRTDRAAMVLEILLCIVLGALFLAVSEFMGMFTLLGAVSLTIRTGIEDSVYTRRLDRMRDAKIEGRWYSDRMR